MTTTSSTPTILLIDQDNRRRESVRRALGAGGYQVVAAERWQSGIALAQEVRPDLVLLDLDLPGLGGDALAVRLSSLPELKQTALIALTQDGGWKTALAAGCDGTLPKPVDPNRLAAQVELFLRAKADLGTPLKTLPENDQISHLIRLTGELASRLEDSHSEVDKLDRQLRETERITEDFLVASARELRTPLTLISGYVTLLKSTVATLDSDPHPLSLAEIANGLVQGARRLSSAVEELSRVSRIVTGQQRLAIEPTQIGRLVMASVNGLDAQERASVEIGNLDGLPVIHADGSQIQVALRNVLHHLVFTRPSVDRILINGEHRQDVVVIAIRGAGLRIDPAVRETLLGRLYPAHLEDGGNSDQGPDGVLSYSLAVAQGIVHAHGGRIWVEDTGKSDTTFFLLLPIRPPG